MTALSPSTVICLMGPTASGKTELALALASVLPVDIISVDSTMIYRKMDIGTATPSAAELARAPHQLINICDPMESYSAAQFRVDALKAIQRSFKKKRTPMLVGGTMLYFRALQKGLSPLPNADPTIREALLKEAHEKGWGALHTELKKIDPKSAMRIHPNDPQRIQRALEVYRISGKTMTELWEKKEVPLPFHFINIALAPKDRAILHQQIEQRFYQMMKIGFLEEVKSLFDRGDLTPDLPAIRAVGYRQAWQYLLGEISEEQMLLDAITATRRLAKRQLTWLRSLEDVTWFDSSHPDLFEQVSSFLLGVSQ